MTKKEFKKTDSKGREEIWEWEETPEAKRFFAFDVFGRTQRNSVF